MTKIFPKPITKLPKADIHIDGLEAYLAQEKNNQILFMKFCKNIEIPPHKHAAQWGIVLEGEIELIIDGHKEKYCKGDRYFIPKEVEHSAIIYAGYSDITFFNEKDIYKIKRS
jgi:quercetin dioxygenase-like cupin family protein